MSDLTAEKHRERHQVLHSEFDELLADFISDTGKLPSKTTVMELMEWSYEQTMNAEEVEDEKEKEK